MCCAITIKDIVMNSIKKNLGYQTIYQILITVLPLITSPYLSRVLGAYQLGICSYTTSIVGYFTLFALLGTTNYGTRSIAACGDDTEKRSRVFWSIYSLEAILSFACAIIYLAYIVLICNENKLISILQGLSIIACFFDINWLFFGMEKFQTTVTRSSIVRVVSVILILTLVKKDQDTWLYVLILTSSTLISNLILWIYAPKYIHKTRISFADIISHVKPNVMLFVPLLAMSVYHIMDKTMLGMLSNYYQSGYYYNADKIVNTTVGVISGFSTVMLPRMTALISNNHKEEANNLFKTSLECTVLTGIAISFGVAAIAKEFVPVFFGPGYDECVLLTIALAPVLIIKSFSFTARYQFLIPYRKEKYYITSVIIGACVNLIANWCMIPQIGALGAVIGTLLAEFSACFMQLFTMRNMIRLKSTYARCFIYCAFGLCMFGAVRAVSTVNVSIYVKLLIEVITGVLSFSLLCLMYWRITNNNIKDILLSSFLHVKRKR